MNALDRSGGLRAAPQDECRLSPDSESKSIEQRDGNRGVSVFPVGDSDNDSDDEDESSAHQRSKLSGERWECASIVGM